MNTSIRTLTTLCALTLAAGAVGCNNTLEQISIPSSVQWNFLNTYIASPYPDLEVLAVGEHITAAIGTNFQPGEALAYCGSATAGAQFITCDGTPANCEAACTSGGFTYEGMRYPYILAVNLNRSAFQAGGVQLTSNIAGGAVDSISFTINNTSQLKLVAGLSEGTIPTSGDPVVPNSYHLVDNYTTLIFEPKDAAFVGATYGDPAAPELRCFDGSSSDVIYFNTQTATAGTYDCGIPISLTLTPPYATVGECISASLEQNCKNQGLTGKARAACNAAQIGNCHASFHVPSALNPN